MRTFGDISNRFDDDPNRTKPSTTAVVKRNRTRQSTTAAPVPVGTKGETKQKSTAWSTRITIADDDDNAPQVQRPRRQSGRLRAKKQREKEERQKTSKVNPKKTNASSRGSSRAVSSKSSTEPEASSNTQHASATGGVATRLQLKRRRCSEGGTGVQAESHNQPEAKRVRQSSSSSSKANARQIDRIARSRLVTIIPGEDQYHCHPDFRLHRVTFSGKNHTLGVARHDKSDMGNVLKNAPYVTDMFQHLFVAETKCRPRPYMAEQHDINAKMRAILIDWLVEVHMKFRLVPETLHLCVNIIDRYCSTVQVQRSKLQLVGVTALLIACKYEEIYPPEVRDCVYITDRAYQSSEVLDMEQDIVQKLAFRITVPTAFPFLQRFLSIIKAPSLVKHAASYYTERTLQEHDMLKYRPSLVCVSAVVLALNQRQIAQETGILLPRDPDRAFMPQILLEYTGFAHKDIIECASVIAVKVALEPVTASNRQLIAVKKKYDNRKFGHISSEFGLPSMPSSY